MPRKLSDEERIEQFFIRESAPECLGMLDTIKLILRIRFGDKETPAKRGRPKKDKPIVAKEAQA